MNDLCAGSDAALSHTPQSKAEMTANAARHKTQSAANCKKGSMIRHMVYLRIKDGGTTMNAASHEIRQCCTFIGGILAARRTNGP
jgi:hypothetical protein